MYSCATGDADIASSPYRLRPQTMMTIARRPRRRTLKRVLSEISPRGPPRRRTTLILIPTIRRAVVQREGVAASQDTTMTTRTKVDERKGADRGISEIRVIRKVMMKVDPREDEAKVPITMK